MPDETSPCNPRSAASHALNAVLATHGLVILGYLIFAMTLSDQRPPNCEGFCLAPRDGIVFIGVALVFPALIVSTVVSMIVVAAAARSGARSGPGAGILVSAGTILVAAIVVSAVVGEPISRLWTS